MGTQYVGQDGGGIQCVGTRVQGLVNGAEGWAGCAWYLGHTQSPRVPRIAHLHGALAVGAAEDL